MDIDIRYRISQFSSPPLRSHPHPLSAPLRLSAKTTYEYVGTYRYVLRLGLGGAGLSLIGFSSLMYGMAARWGRVTQHCRTASAVITQEWSKRQMNGNEMYTPLFIRYKTVLAFGDGTSGVLGDGPTRLDAAPVLEPEVQGLCVIHNRNREITEVRTYCIYKIQVCSPTCKAHQNNRSRL